jgi:hypothetical protein
MADVEDALHLLVERAFVVERGIAPRDRMPGRGVEAAFAVGHSVIASSGEVRGREGWSLVLRASASSVAFPNDVSTRTCAMSVALFATLDRA